MKKEALWIEHILDRIEPVQFTNNDYRNLLNQTDCHICGAPLNEKSKYLDHCHVTGRVRGYACNICNLQFKFKNLYQLFSTIYHHLMDI